MTCCKLTAYEKGIGRYENAEGRGPNHADRLYQPAAILTGRGLMLLLLFLLGETPITFLFIRKYLFTCTVQGCTKMDYTYKSRHITAHYVAFFHHKGGYSLPITFRIHHLSCSNFYY